MSTACPYYTNHAAVAEKCPYYIQHQSDEFEDDFLTSKDHKCPLETAGCSFYTDFKDGKTDKVYDWDTKACPMAEKCPYFDEIKKDGAHAKLHHCPVLKDWCAWN